MIQRTTIQNIIFHLKKDKNKGSQEIIKLLKNALEKEKKQIKEAFEEGMKYGLEGMFPHCDYPASRYYAFTFEQEIEIFTIKVKIEKTKEGIYWATTQNISGSVTSDGNTLDELKENLKEAVNLYIETAKEYNEEIQNLRKGFEFELETKEDFTECPNCGFDFKKLPVQLKLYTCECGKSQADISEHSIRIISDFISVETIEEKLFLLNKHAEMLFDSKEDFSKWLNTPNFFFDEKCPGDFLGTISGIQFIDNRLTAMEYGDNV